MKLSEVLEQYGQTGSAAMRWADKKKESPKEFYRRMTECTNARDTLILLYLVHSVVQDKYKHFLTELIGEKEDRLWDECGNYALVSREFIEPVEKMFPNERLDLCAERQKAMECASPDKEGNGIADAFDVARFLDALKLSLNQRKCNLLRDY